MTKVFNVVYNLNGEEKQTSFSNIPEQVSKDEFALSVYLKKKIAEQENVQEHGIEIVRASATFRSI